MNDFFALTDEQRRLIINQTATTIGIPAEAVEKDLWVTIVLQIVFKLPYSDKLVFKGGTSLSKVWNKIERFSEDIDLAIDRSLFDCSGDLTIKQIKTLRKKSSLFVKDKMYLDLASAIDKNGLSKWCVIEPEPDGDGDKTYPEPRKLFVKYKSLYKVPIDYLKPVVMLEIGSRSLIEPFECYRVNSLIEQKLKFNTTISDVKIPTAVPEKTFIEKIFLLHELFSVESTADVDRKSRHLYDLERMMECDFANSAICNDVLWNTVQHHREIFTHIKGVDYSSDIRDQINLIPQNYMIQAWRSDYIKMQNSMIYGDSMPFEQLLDRMRELQERVRNHSRF